MTPNNIPDVNKIRKWPQGRYSKMAAKMAAKIVKSYKMAHGIFKIYQMGVIVIVMWLSSHKEAIPIPKILHKW